MKTHVMHKREFHFLLISRRSCERAGMRYHVCLTWVCVCVRVNVFLFVRACVRGTA